MFTLPEGMPSELVPISWLVGEWRGDGVLEYDRDGELIRQPFTQSVSFTVEGSSTLRYEAVAHVSGAEPERPDAFELLDARQAAGAGESAAPAPGAVARDADDDAASSADGSAADDTPHPDPADAALDEAPRVLASESGVWRIDRDRHEHDRGPAMLPERGAAYDSAERVETLRGESGDFGVTATLVYGDGIAEVLTGTVSGARIDLASTAHIGPRSAGEFTGSSRMYGLVQGNLFWAWDVAMLGLDLRSHASGRLTRIDE